MEYYLFHKPAGCVTARSDDRWPTIFEYLADIPNPNLFPVGRLDKETEGLLLLTDDGKWANELMQPASKVEKTYFFWALGELTEQKISQLVTGVTNESFLASEVKIFHQGDFDAWKEELDKLPLIPAKCKQRQQVVAGEITICQGKKHQVKRMLKAVECYVIYLRRERIGSLSLDETIAPGQWRRLEITDILTITQNKKSIDTV